MCIAPLMLWPCLFGATLAPSLPDIPPSTAPETQRASEELAVIHFPDEVELQVLVDYVGKSLDLHFLYGEELKGQKVELRPSPVTIPKSELLNLLTSLLRVRDLVLAEESPGFYRIVKTEQSSRNSLTILPTTTRPDPESLRLVTQVLSLPGAKMEGLGDKLAQFVSSPKGALLSIPERGLLIVTDYESRIALLQELLTAMDVGERLIETRTIATPAGDPIALAQQVSTILADTQRVRQSKEPPPAIRGDVVPQSVVIIGTAVQIQEAQTLVERLQPPTAELNTRSYSPLYLSAERLEALIKHVVLAPGGNIAAPAAVYRDPQSQRLFVTAGGETHRAIASLLTDEDKPLPATQRPLRVYSIKNRKAGELLSTITQLLGQGARLVETTPTVDGKNPDGPLSSVPGPNLPPPAPSVVQVPPTPPAQRKDPAEESAARSLLRVEGPDYVLTEDSQTNSILAIGTREFHAQLASLLEELDRRRPQVLIEMTLVAITMRDSQDLGVELETLDLGDAWDYLAFSNFGLSEIDVATGQRILSPGVGANGVLLGPDEVPILFRALATKGMAKVLSTPKLLVSDNARGMLRNVDEAPFTSVNASDTVATTSFAGFESAGTTLSVTPKIAEGDHLTLDYELTFSNFSGTSSNAAIPPPRTTNSFRSTVEVPDGHTVVTGGLIVDNDSDTVNEVPYLGRIPILGKAFQNSSKQKTKTKIFVFIRPVILRDDQFEDLKGLTLRDVESAELPATGAVPGEPLWMR